MKAKNSKNVTDLTYLKQVSNGDNNFIKEMIEVYIQQTPEAIMNLEHHLENKDWKKLFAVTHKMKPSFSFFGLTDMFETVDSIEEYSENEIHLELLADLIAKVKLTCSLAVLELEQKKNLAVIS
jgi:HPt (histidine-containing phosphotransfer) domain-containing protein